MGDVVVPEFGPVSCAVVHTRAPATVARDLAGVEGVQSVAYMDADALIVLSRGGRAVIHERAGRFSYESINGDPLKMQTVFDSLRETGALDADGFASDADLFNHT